MFKILRFCLPSVNGTYSEISFEDRKKLEFFSWVRRFFASILCNWNNEEKKEEAKEEPVSYQNECFRDED
ncbi:hypothetical protein L596_015247 [Steinernema carpocapsae]|uniref:Uncharacterized protein n=1 Tax=Steinernema carpocapsae TaxID=34508 RepID=A0A4U5NEE6_STECR|nr:hypothetical protein L596_015247 [Steinernema carpocapsae]